MQIIPTENEVVALLRETGALREGHFQYPSGLHSDRYLQVGLAMRNAQTAKVLSVALSRKLRAHPEIRAMVGELSIVAPDTGGLPVAYGVCEAMGSKQVYYTERGDDGSTLRFRPYQEPQKGEKILLVDDVLRTGRKLAQLKQLAEERGAEVVGLAVIVYQPNPELPSFGDLPFYYLAQLDAMYYWDSATAAEKEKIVGPIEKVWA